MLLSYSLSIAPVVLDPNTSFREISEHLTCLTPCSKSLSIPNPERCFKLVLGHEGFTSGKHSWDVEVDGYWTVGVCTKKIMKWGIYVCPCSYILREITPECDIETVYDNLPLQKVRVQLDCDQGILSFIDLGQKMPPHTIRYRCSEKLFPYFRDKAKILPAELSVKIKQQK